VGAVCRCGMGTTHSRRPSRVDTLAGELKSRVSGWRMTSVSIVRVGLTETKGYAEGYDAIFNKGKAKKSAAATPAKSAAKKTAPVKATAKKTASSKAPTKKSTTSKKK
jgi:hypothetical protein